MEVEVSRDPARAAPGAVIQKRFSPEAAKGLGLYWVDIYDEPGLIGTKLAALRGRESNCPLSSEFSIPPGVSLYIRCVPAYVYGVSARDKAFVNW